MALLLLLGLLAGLATKWHQQRRAAELFCVENPTGRASSIRTAGRADRTHGPHPPAIGSVVVLNEM